MGVRIPGHSGAPLLVQRAHSVEADELRRDLAAVGVDETHAAGTLTFRRDAILTRPTLLRRIAAMLARYVPATADRLIAETCDAPLAAAVALHTGLPFALVAPAAGGVLPRRSVRGELYPSERVVAVSLLAPTTSLIDTARLLGVHVLAEVAVVGHAGGSCPDSASLFPMALPIPTTSRKEAEDE